MWPACQRHPTCSGEVASLSPLTKTELGVGCVLATAPAHRSRSVGDYCESLVPTRPLCGRKTAGHNGAEPGSPAEVWRCSGPSARPITWLVPRRDLKTCGYDPL